MSLTASDISRIANLARLELSEPEAGRMLTQLNGFFGIVEKMSAVDTTGILPMAHPIEVFAALNPRPEVLRLRADIASEPNQREANQRSAPSVDRGLFLVPRVIE